MRGGCVLPVILFPSWGPFLLFFFTPCRGGREASGRKTERKKMRQQQHGRKWITPIASLGPGCNARLLAPPRHLLPPPPPLPTSARSSATSNISRVSVHRATSPGGEKKVSEPGLRKG
ncbi:hypothetical protein HPB50_018655 [Hyalomma asiaticum]|uniref:Uncharacterized protein n=1 Tax=Hyalomma asiaticum TaxID=266040 RepID=A0ACB7SJB5_HYAAI|nr:hypothetical protein HPB50_018655 [Hyalomma asiaticum]